MKITMIKKVLLIVLAILILMQFYRPARNIAAGVQPKALKNKYSIPPNTESALTVACYDCHSNNTKYPWYAEIQPVNLYLTRHVNEGKEKLNFDEFLSYPPKKQLKKLKEVIELTEKKKMPLSSYTLIHRDAVLSDSQRADIIVWAKKVRAEIEASPSGL